MPWISPLITAARRGSRAAQVACLRGVGVSWPVPWPGLLGDRGKRGQVVAEPQPVSFVQGEAAGLGRVTVAYERQGCGEPVVLLHGLGCHRRAWDPVGSLLAGQREAIAM